SVGAINACALAASADILEHRAARMVRNWTQLRVGHVLRFDPGELLSILRGVLGRRGPARKGGIIDPTGLQRIVQAAIDFPRIDENVRAGKFAAVTVSTTQIKSGRTTVYLDRTEPGLPHWGHDPTILCRRAKLTAAHALASAAIPLLFPPILL